MPKVSVVICTFNRADLLPKAVGSVLSQSFSDFEIIIIDDASTDSTREVVGALLVKDKRIRYFLNDNNLGIAKSRNKGVSLSNSEYVSMLDSDDYWIDDNKLLKQVRYLDDNSDVSLIGTAISLVNSYGLEIKKDVYHVDDKSIRANMLRKNQFSQSSVLFRKNVFDNVGGYDVGLRVCEDYDLWLRMGADYKLANLSDVCVAYLIHSNGVSKSRRQEIVSTTDLILEKYKYNYPYYFVAKLKSYLRFILFIFLK